MTTEELEFLYEERAAILEYDGNLPREEAEQRARELVYGDGKQVNACKIYTV